MAHFTNPLISMQIKDELGRLQTPVYTVSYSVRSQSLLCAKGEHGGEGGIRTHDTLASIHHPISPDLGWVLESRRLLFTSVFTSNVWM